MTTEETCWKKQCATLLEDLAKSKNSYPFRVPVDTFEYKDYLEKIGGNPMDLLTIKGKLQNNAYETPIDFVKDVQLIFENSEKYNTDERTMIYKTTLKFSSDFRRSEMNKILYNSGKTEATGRGLKRNIDADRDADRGLLVSTNSKKHCTKEIEFIDLVDSLEESEDEIEILSQKVPVDDESLGLEAEDSLCLYYQPSPTSGSENSSGESSDESTSLQQSEQSANSRRRSTMY